MQLSEPISCILKNVSKLALVLLLNTNERFRVVIEVCSAAFGTYRLYSKKTYQNLHQCCYRIPMNGSGWYSKFVMQYSEPHLSNSKIYGFKCYRTPISDSYQSRFQRSSSSPYSTTSGTRLCVPIPHPNSSYTKRGA